MEQDAPVELKRKVLATVTALKEGLIERETEVRTFSLGYVISVSIYLKWTWRPWTPQLKIPLQLSHNQSQHQNGNLPCLPCCSCR